LSSPGAPQQPYPSDQFGQQGGFPPPGGQPGGFPPPAQAGGFPPPQDGGLPPQQGGFPPGPAPQPPRRSGGGRRLITRFVIIAVVIGGLVALGIYLNRDAASSAKVGDCVTQEGNNELKVVKCDDASADFKVVGRVENKTRVEASLNACDAFPDAQQAYWEGKQGEKGLVLCLAPAS
jgi:hypothetical protein